MGDTNLGLGLGVVFGDDVAGAPPSFSFLLQESGFLLLQENGSNLIIT